MNPTTEQAIRDHVEAEFPREACGVIVVVKGKDRYLPCTNIAESAEQHFVLHPEDLAAAHDVGEVIKIVHSHPNTSADISPADRTQCNNGIWPWVIVSVMEGKVQDIREYEPDDYEAPLIGRTFVHGIHDCYALFRDWYVQVRGIELPDYERQWEWWDKGQSLYLDNFEAAGFVDATGPIQIGDGILMQIRSPVPNHIAVYIGDGKIMHHPINRLSTEELYMGYWHEVTYKVIRYGK